MKRKRRLWTNWDYKAVCLDCEWSTHGKNGLGLAAQHHDRTGHSVNISVEGLVKYISEAEYRLKNKDRMDFLL